MPEPTQLRPPRHLPVEPLESAIWARLAPRMEDRKGELTLAFWLSENDRRDLYRARAAGYITDRMADRICVTRLKLHPAELYGPAWYEAEEGEPYDLDDELVVLAEGTGPAAPFTASLQEEPQEEPEQLEEVPVGCTCPPATLRSWPGSHFPECPAWPGSRPTGS
jgi:hypothetical protein